MFTNTFDQATMLMWWDGLAETENHIMEEARQTNRDNVSARAVSMMVAEVAGTPQPGEKESGAKRTTTLEQDRIACASLSHGERLTMSSEQVRGIHREKMRKEDDDH